ncbi:MAG: type II secretion system F family protein [Patescibacteria group bacterium]
MRFQYQARTNQGQIQSGAVEAFSKDAAISLLQSHGLYVTLLEEEEKALIFFKNVKIFEKVSRKDLVLFFRQLSILFKSNVPVVESLHTIASQTRKRHFKEKISKIAEKVEGGTSLSQAFGTYPKVFSPFYISMVKSGELSGKLFEVLGYLAEHTEREYNFYSKLIGALIYPIFVLIVFVVILILMLVIVIPTLSNLLLETGQQLPAITKAVIALSSFLRTWWWLISILSLAFLFFLVLMLRTEEGRIFLNRASLRAPILQGFLKKIYLLRIAENLSTLISSGLPIVQAIEITGEIVGNRVYKDIMSETKERVKRGEPISAVLTGHPDFFPPLFTQMAAVGEKTGQLDSSLLNIVTLYSGEVDRTLDSFIKFLEPLLIITLGLLIAGLVASVITPLYQIQIV